MAAPPAKTALKDELLQLLERELATAQAALASAREGATHEEAKPEDDKDTRALEQSYLARGQAVRVEELQRGVVEVRSMALRAFGDEALIALSALVTVEEGDSEKLLFLAAHGGGVMLAGGRVQVVTPRSPLGRALLGKRAGDDAELIAGGKARALSILAVQ